MVGAGSVPTELSAAQRTERSGRGGGRGEMHTHVAPISTRSDCLPFAHLSVVPPTQRASLSSPLSPCLSSLSLSVQ